MLLEQIQTVISDLAEALTGVKVVRRYKGEFEEGAENTNVDYPAVFVRVASAIPGPVAPDNSVLKWKVRYLVYIADKNVNESSVLSTVEAVIDFFDGVQMSFDIGTGENKQTFHFATRITEGGLEWFGYNTGVEVYTLLVEAE